MQFPIFKESGLKEVTMVQHLELVLKRDFTSRLRHAIEKVRLLLEKRPAEASKKKTEGPDWKEKFGKNWYY